MLDRPLIFKPYLKTVLWGGDRIVPFKGISSDLDNIGESWEVSCVAGHESVVDEGHPLAGESLPSLIRKYGADLVGSKVFERYGENFPLLIKLIDARRDLSVQVHPGDQLAQQRHSSPGKTEMWYIIDALPGAKIYSGLSAPLDPDCYVRRVADHTIMDVVGVHDSAPGQFYYIPAGTIHAIGAGNLLAEIQQSSDVTYRIYDYDRRDADGNPRELHTELAKDAIDYRFPHDISPTAQAYAHSQPAAVNSPYFSVDYLHLSKEDTYNVDTKGDSFVILMVTAGQLSITLADNKTYTYPKGSTILVPACICYFSVSGLGDALLVAC